MSDRTTICRRGALAAAALAFAAEAGMACDADRPIGIVANDQPLEKIVETIALACGIDVVSSAALSERASTAAGGHAASEALRRLLRAHNYVMRVDAAGRPVHLRIFGQGVAQRIAVDRQLQGYRRDLSDHDPDTRIDAVLSLAESDDSDAGRALLSLSLEDPDPGVREAAEAVLEDMGDTPPGRAR